MATQIEAPKPVYTIKIVGPGGIDTGAKLPVDPTAPLEQLADDFEIYPVPPGCTLTIVGLREASSDPSSLPVAG